MPWAKRLRGPSCPGSRHTTPGREGQDRVWSWGAHSLRCCVQGRRAWGVRGEAAQWTDRDVWRQGLRCGCQEPSARCELTRRSFSQDALGDYRILYTSHVPIPGPALGPAALLADLLTPPLPSPAVWEPRCPPSQPLAPGPAVPPLPQAASSSRPGPGALTTSAWAPPDPLVLTGGAAAAPCGPASPKPGPPEKGVP